MGVEEQVASQPGLDGIHGEECLLAGAVLLDKLGAEGLAWVKAGGKSAGFSFGEDKVDDDLLTDAGQALAAGADGFRGAVEIREQLLQPVGLNGAGAVDDTFGGGLILLADVDG